MRRGKGVRTVVLWRSLKRVLRLSITIRLALGFSLAALLAATTTGLIGFQRLTVLHTQADFYLALLQNTTTLNTGSDCLKAIDIQSTELLADASAPHKDEETLTQDEQSLQTLLQQYQTIILSYLTRDLLLQHPDQIMMIKNGSGQEVQQHTYGAGAWRTWLLYETTEQQILQDVKMDHLSSAQELAHLLRLLRWNRLKGRLRSRWGSASETLDPVSRLKNTPCSSSPSCVSNAT